MATCIECGYEAPDSFKFCPECGGRVDGRGREQRKVVTPALSAPRSMRSPRRRQLNHPPSTRDRIGDRGYDHDKHRRLVRARGIKPVIARRNTEHGSGLGRHRWVVERTLSWLHQMKRLLVRYERRAEIHEAFLAPGCCLICFRRLRSSN